MTIIIILIIMCQMMEMTTMMTERFNCHHFYCIHRCNLCGDGLMRSLRVWAWKGNRESVLLIKKNKQYAGSAYRFPLGSSLGSWPRYVYKCTLHIVESVNVPWRSLYQNSRKRGCVRSKRNWEIYWRSDASHQMLMWNESFGKNGVSNFENHMHNV